MDYNGSIIWNPKHFSFWVINTDIMSFKDNDLKDACLPILAPVIDQIWSVVLANPPGVMLSEYARWQAWQGTGEWTQQNSHLASTPRHICSSFVLPFLLCGLPTSFYAPWLPLFWTTCPTLSSSDHNCYWPWNIHFLPGFGYLKNLKGEGYLGDLRLWWSNRFPGSLRSAASSLGPFSNRTVAHTDIWTMNY